MASIKHVHTYERSKYNKEIYKCVHPLCTHFTRRDLIVGKVVLCHTCNNETTARQEQLRAGQNQVGTKKLTCIYCAKGIPRPETIPVPKSAIEELLAESLLINVEEDLMESFNDNKS